jgi:hypothetical protein
MQAVGIHKPVKLKVGKESKSWKKINRTGPVKQDRDISSNAAPRGSILASGLETLDEHLIMMAFIGGRKAQMKVITFCHMVVMCIISVSCASLK